MFVVFNAPPLSLTGIQQTKYKQLFFNLVVPVDVHLTCRGADTADNSGMMLGRAVGGVFMHQLTDRGLGAGMWVSSLC